MTDKSQLYELLSAQLCALTEGERHFLPNLANASALIYHALEGVNWVGFYLSTADGLLLGPFQGQPACIRIPIGKGVCGTAAQQMRTLCVADVHSFPGHIACDARSQSEIVVPLIHDGRVVAIMDLDSPRLARFDEIDQLGLECLSRTLESACDWSAF